MLPPCWRFSKNRKKVQRLHTVPSLLPALEQNTPKPRGQAECVLPETAVPRATMTALGKGRGCWLDEFGEFSQGGVETTRTQLPSLWAVTDTAPDVLSPSQEHRAKLLFHSELANSTPTNPPISRTFQTIYKNVPKCVLQSIFSRTSCRT